MLCRYALCPCVLACHCDVSDVLSVACGEMRGDRYCVTRVTSCLAEWPLLYLAIFLSPLTDLEITPISPARLPVLFCSERVSLFANVTLIVSAHDSVHGSIHFSVLGNFRTLHSTHSRFYSTNHCIAQQ